MTASAEDWYARTIAAIERDGHRPWDPTGWSTWPFDRDLSPRPLDPPAETEPPRHGAAGVDCAQCEKAALDDPSRYVFWRDDVAMLGVPFGSTSLPFLGFLMPRRHADLSDLTAEEAARMGVLQVEVERAVCAVLDVPRLHLIRWGDGSEHLHWWLYGRPSRVLQLRGTFLSHWDDLLPVRDPVELRADLDAVAARLFDAVGGECFPG